MPEQNNQNNLAQEPKPQATHLQNTFPEKSPRRWIILGGLVIIVLMLFSLVGYIFYKNNFPQNQLQAQDDPYGALIQEFNRGMSPQTLESGPPPLQEGPHRLQLHVVSAATGEELRGFQMSLYPREGARFGTGRLGEVVWPSWKAYHDVVGVVTIDGLPEDRFFLMVYSPGYVRYGQGVTAPHEKVLEIVLIPKTARLSGRVVDAVTSAPLAGATVTMGYSIGTREGLDGIADPDFRPVTTSADGTFRLEPLAGEGYVTRLDISHDGYFREGRTLAAATPWKEALGDILLYPHASIEGQVIDAVGQPVQDQPVYILQEEVPYQDIRAVARLLAGKSREDAKAMRYRTDADGRFETIPMPGDRYRIVYGSSLDRHVELIELEYGDKRTIRLEKR